MRSFAIIYSAAKSLGVSPIWSWSAQSLASSGNRGMATDSPLSRTQSLRLRFCDALRDESADQQAHRFDWLNPDRGKVAEHESGIAERGEVVGFLLVLCDLRRHPVAADVI